MGKKGKIVIVLSGRYAGKKAVIMKSYDKGTESHRFGHCLVAGIQRPPRNVTRAMGKAKRDKRSKMKPFLKRVNYNHVMPTRYQVTDMDLKGINISDVASDDVEKKKANLKTLKAVFRTALQGPKQAEERQEGLQSLSVGDRRGILVRQAAILSVSAGVSQ